MHYRVIDAHSARLCAIHEQIENLCFRCENIQDERIFSNFVWIVSTEHVLALLSNYKRMHFRGGQTK